MSLLLLFPDLGTPIVVKNTYMYLSSISDDILDLYVEDILTARWEKDAITYHHNVTINKNLTVALGTISISNTGSFGLIEGVNGTIEWGSTNLTGTGILTFGRIKINGLSEFGDGGTTNYASFATDGELSLHGTARVTECMWLSAGGIKAPGSKPATFVECGLTGAWQFADAIEANQESVSGTLKIPCNMDKTVAPLFHIGWSANGVSPGNCEWQLEYFWLGPNDDTCAAAQETLTSTSTASSTSDGFVFVTFTGIDLPDSTDLAMLWKITRLSADGNDTIADTVEMRGAAFTRTVNKLGNAL